MLFTVDRFSIMDIFIVATQENREMVEQQAAEQRILASQAARGRLGAGETAEQLQDAFTRSSLGFLGQQRSDLLNALRFGQASAAQQAAAGVQTGANVGNLLTQIGNAQASGIVGAANARAQGIQNLAGLASFGLGGGFGGISSNPYRYGGIGDDVG